VRVELVIVSTHFLILQVVMHREQNMRGSPSVSTYGSLEQNEMIGSNGTGPDSGGSRAAVPEGILLTPMIVDAPSSNQALHTESAVATSPSFPSLDQVDVDLTPRIGRDSRTETDSAPDTKRPGPLFPFWNFGRQLENTAEDS
jgi:hypothetical protein